MLFCYSFGNLTVLPEGRVIKKSNEPFVFVTTDVFMGLSINRDTDLILLCIAGQQLLNAK